MLRRVVRTGGLLTWLKDKFIMSFLNKADSLSRRKLAKHIGGCIADRVDPGGKNLADRGEHRT
jgi:site-specific recombinase